MQQELQYQGSGAAAVENSAAYAEDTAAYATDDARGSDVPTQAEDDAWRVEHAINVRMTIPLPLTSYYLTIVGGKERRNPDRRADERYKHPLVTKGNIAFLSVLGLTTGLALFTLIQIVARFALERAGVI